MRIKDCVNTSLRFPSSSRSTLVASLASILIGLLSVPSPTVTLGDIKLLQPFFEMKSDKIRVFPPPKKKNL